MKKSEFNQNLRSSLGDLVLKDTSLIYLKDALEAQRFEECPGLIRYARSFGASPQEIKTVLSDYRRRVFWAHVDDNDGKIQKRTRF